VFEADETAKSFSGNRMIAVSLAEFVVETAPGPSLVRFRPSLFQPPIGKRVDRRSRQHIGASSLRLEGSGRVLGHSTWGLCRVQERGCCCETVKQSRCAGCFSEGNRQRPLGFICHAGWMLRSWTWTSKAEHRVHSAEPCEGAGRVGGADPDHMIKSFPGAEADPDLPDPLASTGEVMQRLEA
jgi:hypothetical protein